MQVCHDTVRRGGGRFVLLLVGDDFGGGWMVGWLETEAWEFGRGVVGEAGAVC